MTQRKLEAAIGLFLALLSAAFYWLVIPVYAPGSMFAETPPDLLPKACTVLIGALGGLMFLHRAFFEAEDGAAPAISLLDLRQMAVIVACFAAAILAMRLAGYIAGGAMLVAALMVYMRTRSLLRIAVTAGLTPLLLYGLFELLLGVPLP